MTQRTTLKWRTPLWLLSLLLLPCFPAVAQLAPSEPDPLARIRDAAKNNAVACSATGETLCEQVAPKIIANAEGDSPLAAGLARLAEAARNDVRSTNEPPVIARWAIESFRDAKVDAHTEQYSEPPSKYSFGPQDGYDVVAEIRGREKPEEWVLLAANLETTENAAAVIEAARDIQLTGIHPRRTIRFVIFVQGHGSLHYVQAHREELDRTRAVMIFSASTNPVNGFVLNGRHDIERGVTEALDPIRPMGVTHHTFDAPLEPYGLYFVLEGIPTLLAAPSATSDRRLSSANSPTALDAQELRELKRNTAIAAVSAFAIAERAEPIGPRQSRAEVDELLKSTGLEFEMKAHHYWPRWEALQRDRQP